MREYAKRYAGRLLLRDEIELPDYQLQALIKRGYFKLKPALIKRYFTHQCQRCGNKARHLFGVISCSNCQTAHLYCRKCIQMGRVMSCTPLYYWVGPDPDWTATDKRFAWKGELTKTQSQASDRVCHAIANGVNELLIHAVCGSGKTEIVFAGVAQVLNMNKRVCLATPRADVVRELLPRLQSAFPTTSIVGLYGGSGANQKTAQLTLSTTHQLLRYDNAFDLMIIDEMDAFPYHADPSLPYATKKAIKPGATTLYLTATPRQDMINHSKTPTVFVPERYHQFPLPVPKSVLLLKCPDLTWPKVFWKWYEQRPIKRQVLVFIATINRTQCLLPLIQSRYPQARIEAVHAKDPERITKVDLFRAKQLDVLLTTTILERGVTFPAIDVVVLDAGHPVFDQAALVQIAGRAGRSKVDPTGEVLFFHDGQTIAIREAIRSIKKMNKKAKIGKE